MADRTIEILVELTDAGAISNAEDMRAALGAIQATSDSTGTSMLNMGAKIGRVSSLGMVAWDRLSIAQNAVENAQIRQTLSSERLNEAIEKHGRGSKEAAKAQEELDIATRGVTIAQERELVRMTIGIAVVIPSMLKGIRDLVGMGKLLDTANLSNVATTDALTSSRLALLAATGIGLVAAVGIGAAIAGGAFRVSTPTEGVSNYNFYGDNHFTGVTGPAGIATTINDTTQVGYNRGDRH